MHHLIVYLLYGPACLSATSQYFALPAERTQALGEGLTHNQYSLASINFI